MTEWFEGRSTDEQMERCYWRRVGFVAFLAILLAIILAPLVGCANAPERYMTAEQDAEMKAACEEVGCVAVPMPAWVQIEAILKRAGAI